MGIETIEYDVCHDCLFYIAYGDVPENDDEYFYAEKIANEIGDRKGYFVTGGVSEGEDEESEFSWHECELCRTGLGGPRHKATLLIETEETSA